LTNPERPYKRQRTLAGDHSGEVSSLSLFSVAEPLEENHIHKQPKETMKLDGTNNGESDTNGNSKNKENGHKATKNGDDQLENGSQTSIDGAISPKKNYHGHDREEVTRLIIQTLHDMGYPTAAHVLQEESECSIESEEVSAFRTAVLEGSWKQAEILISRLELHPDADIATLLFFIRRQKFLETLEIRDLGAALVILRSELAPLKQDVDQLHVLSSLVMCTSTEDLRIRAEWDGAGGTSRHQLLSDLQVLISPSVMIPENRLSTLLHQAKLLQVSQCLYHNTSQPITLYTNHVCDKTQFPSTSIEVLTEHRDEVWNVKFSHNGRFLASSSKDGSVIIWVTEFFEPLHVLPDHDRGVSAVAWSPDDSRLLSCSQDSNIKLWDPMSGVCLATYSAHIDSVSSCAWHPSSEGFISGSMDKEIIWWNSDGTINHRWSGIRAYDLAITPDGQKLVAICTDRKIHVWTLRDKQSVATIQMSSEMTSVSVSKDSRFALINVCSQEVHLWDLDTMQLVKKYVGQQQGRFVIRSCFGGGNENFIVSGSEGKGLPLSHHINCRSKDICVASRAWGAG